MAILASFAIHVLTVRVPFCAGRTPSSLAVFHFPVRGLDVAAVFTHLADHVDRARVIFLGTVGTPLAFLIGHPKGRVLQFAVITRLYERRFQLCKLLQTSRDQKTREGWDVQTLIAPPEGLNTFGALGSP
jgi:hypothetical protein